MAKKLSHDQKRKQKLAKEKARQRERIMPYEGDKYKAPEYLDVLMRAETGILEAYVLSQRKLTDRQVEKSLEYLVFELRGQKPSEPPEGSPLVEVEGGAKEDMIAARIKDHWADLFTTQPRPRLPASDLAGVLRAIMNSVRVHALGPYSQAYLRYIEKFLGKLGVSVEALQPEEFDQIQAEHDLPVHHLTQTSAEERQANEKKTVIDPHCA
jgi:hypothetical protein